MNPSLDGRDSRLWASAAEQRRRCGLAHRKHSFRSRLFRFPRGVAGAAQPYLELVNWVSAARVVAKSFKKLLNELN